MDSTGLLKPELFMGFVSSVSALHAKLTLVNAGAPTASHFETHRYGRGEVGEFVLIEGQLSLVLARVIEVVLPETERRTLADGFPTKSRYDVTGVLQLLGTVQWDSLRVSPGVSAYPRIGDRVFAAPHAFVSRIPSLQDADSGSSNVVALVLGTVKGAGDAAVLVKPEKLFGRHCAVLGATGGGKSWTVARLLEEAVKFRSKVMVLDATGEYRTLPSSTTKHTHLGQPVKSANGSAPCGLPPHNFQEADFVSLFEPAGKVQGPKLRDAIRSLRLVRLVPELAGPDGELVKHTREKASVMAGMKQYADQIEDPTSPFDVSILDRQVHAECVWPSDGQDQKKWGGQNVNDLTFCLPLITRIRAIVASVAFAPVFGEIQNALLDQMTAWLESPTERLLRVCLSGVSYEFRAREYLVNAIGRMVLTMARTGRFADQPLIVVLDEAHNFLGRSVGNEDGRVALDAFELIAREGRKYGLNICLATQRPRDLTESVLSQVGTLVVHRLTNDKDREIVERACGEIDRSASAFLAGLKSGEAAIVGVDFPIPLTVHVAKPSVPPASDGPDYQTAWAAP